MQEVLLALLPILLLSILMVLFRIPAIKSMPIAWLSALIISIIYWKIYPEVIIASNIKGILIALEISIIIVGAIFLLEVVKQSGIIKQIDSLLKSLSHDRRVHAIIIAWSFGVLIEGSAGFGTPAALAAPLLVGLGIPALPAVIVSLIANSTPVSFGAIGTPILIGLGTSVKTNLADVTFYVALLHAVIGLFIPLVISCVISKFTQGSFFKGLELWKFSLLAGASFVVPYFIIALYAGPEFPSLAGGLVGLILVMFFASKGIFLTKNKSKLKLSSLRVLSPYLLAVLILFITRLKPVNSFLKSLSLNLVNITDSNVSYSFYPLLSPGVIFFLIALLFSFKLKSHLSLIKKSALRSAYAFITLIFTVSFVQLLLNSGANLSGLPSMPVAIAKVFAFGNLFILFSPFIGMFGAFIAGSNTVSNLLFAPFQYETALALTISPVLILALQTVGGAVGNMIAPHNIIAASATVNLKHKEGKIIITNIWPALAYVLLAGLIALLFL